MTDARADHHAKGNHDTCGDQTDYFNGFNPIFPPHRPDRTARVSVRGVKQGCDHASPARGQIRSADSAPPPEASANRQNPRKARPTRRDKPRTKTTAEIVRGRHRLMSVGDTVRRIAQTTTDMIPEIWICSDNAAIVPNIIANKTYLTCVPDVRISAVG